LRRNSLEIVDGERSSRRAISRTPAPCARSTAISSGSSKHKYRHETGSSMNVAMPPRSRNHRLPAACDTPTASAASSLPKPSAIRRQNARSTSRRSDGLPGDLIDDRPVNSFIHPAGLPTTTPFDQVLRRQACGKAGIARSMGSRGDCFDNAVAESFFATLKKELVHRRSWPTRRELTSEVFEYIEGFYNPTRRHSTLGYLSPIQYEETLPPTTSND
jgi:hypothetical protein